MVDPATAYCFNALPVLIQDAKYPDYFY